MKKLVRASLLILALSCTTYAGDMPFPVAGPQPARMNVQEPTTNDALEQSATERTMAEAMLNLISSVLSLF